MTAPRFLTAFAATALVLTGAAATFNILVDPDDLFPSLNIPHLDRGDRYNGHERIGKLFEFESREPFSGVLLGGSRVAYEESGEMDKITAQRWYNFGLANFNVRELPAYARRITERPSVKTVMVGLAFYSFSIRDSESATIDPDVVAGTPLGRLKHLLELVLSWDTTIDSGRTVVRAITAATKKARSIQGYDEAGNRIRGQLDESVRLAGWKKVRDSFGGQYSRFRLDVGRLAALRTLRDEMAARGVRLIFYIPPVSQDLLDLIAQKCPDDFRAWKTELAKISDYWDFSEPSSVTADPNNFYDPSHAKGALSRWIFGRIWGQEEASVPADFGRHVERISE